jgi:hypothetical protein
MIEEILKEIARLNNHVLGRTIIRQSGIGFEVCYTETLYRIDGKMCQASSIPESLDHVSDIEKFIIRKIGFENYWWSLSRICGNWSSRGDCFDIQICDYEQGVSIATATARQRAEACLFALKTHPPHVKNDAVSL